jgi:hypothetical protein
MARSTAVWGLSTVPGGVAWLKTGGVVTDCPAAVELVGESAGLVLDVVVGESCRPDVLELVVVECLACAAGTE